MSVDLGIDLGTASVNRIFNTTLAIQIFSKRNIMIHMLQLNTIMVWLQISMIRNIM